MVIDYREVWRAADALRALSRADVTVLYTPNKLVAVSADPTTTHLFVHGLEVAPQDRDRATAILDEFDLWPPPPDVGTSN